MSKSSVLFSYAQSLGWIALLVTFLFMMSLSVHLVTFDLIHGNPNRPLSNVVLMMTLENPLIAFVAVVDMLLTFTLPQLFQAWLVVALRRFGDGRARLAVLPLLPLTAVLTWYCYEYLTFLDVAFMDTRLNGGSAWTSYRYGISGSRYLWALLFQAPITLFSFLYLELGDRNRSRKMLLLLTFALLIVGGGVAGERMTATQIRLQQQSRH